MPEKAGPSANPAPGLRTRSRGRLQMPPAGERTVTVPEPQEEVRVTAIEARNAMEDIFKRIGTDEFPETILPAGNKNTAAEAREFATAQALKKMADSRFKEAEEKARALGILGSEDEYVEGQTRIVYSTPSFDITAKRNKGSKQLDKDLLQAALAEHGISAAKLLEIMTSASKPRKGATQIEVALKT